MYYIIIFIIIGLIILFNLFVLILKIKINILEGDISYLFKKRNYQVVSLYAISDKYITRHNEVFQSFLELKRKDLSENMHFIRLDDKIPTYQKLHNEISFIFKICDKHEDLKKNAIYNYIKESIVEKSQAIWEKYRLYREINKKYKKLHFFSKFSLVGLLY